MGQTSLSTQRQAIYLNKNLHVSFYPLWSLFYVATNFVAIKSCEGKILRKLPICSKKQSGFQSLEDGKALEAPFKVNGPQKLKPITPQPRPTNATSGYVPNQKGDVSSPKDTC